MIDSEDAEVWAAEIKKAWTKIREIRLQESKTVWHSYVTKYNWEEQCRDLVEKVRCVVHGMSCMCLCGENFNCPRYSPSHVCWKTSLNCFI